MKSDSRGEGEGAIAVENSLADANMEDSTRSTSTALHVALRLDNYFVLAKTFPFPPRTHRQRDHPKQEQNPRSSQQAIRTHPSLYIEMRTIKR